MPGTITRLNPIPRQQGIQVPGLLPVAQWSDTLVLVANTAQTYTFPTDGAGHKATILRINATSGPIFINFYRAATVPGVLIDGTSSIILHAELVPILMAVFGTSFSLISAGTPTVGIEAWG